MESNTANSGLSKKTVEKETGNIIDYVDLKKLPQFAVLNQQVLGLVNASSWWERHGQDWFLLLVSFAGYFSSYYLLTYSDPLTFVSGIFVLGLSHSSITVKSAHMAAHGAFSSSNICNRVLSFVCTDFIGTFSADVGYSIHVKCHHPHTNIIGLGDSSTFRASFVPSVLYMFVTPLLMPVLTPAVAMKEIMSKSALCIARHIFIAYIGLIFHIYLLMSISGLHISLALAVIFLSRDVLAIPYIHVNIFQHIGLPMYSQQHRPKKIYQMTTGVLNLPRNPILDFCFGHGIISCHTEHHLFPSLSDNMCLKIQPVVFKFCQEHDLPYHTDTYYGRVWHFLSNYKQLMVDSPPVTKFVGLQ
ncbi:fatty acid desaturase 6 [Biomphalaria glabrata]|uniref:Fatty acid desaturase 6-like n=1 Tax=Biomphalaria glabrata TaxID=6526 RepID=A0A9W3APM8_BIOGL|nr:fatty acid desaturase 6-like [Biomphalaria glabrata]XP_013064249.2 fatty acid desaturase 6-like [Biomphalaria glabrata]XP_055889190.1 fatty acid desaturase 6-like [Biomphalaria glabrata]XP_055889191.1 fatty acid desaturase 6-like [Biomphalaria glabrata]KAI8735453.1 fatty acid desaturase 6 [Biomphalaria glabrata]KAI8759048.1 fatty acid desaturase 6-like [Biomphalaria glabrata]